MLQNLIPSASFFCHLATLPLKRTETGERRERMAQVCVHFQLGGFHIWLPLIFDTLYPLRLQSAKRFVGKIWGSLDTPPLVFTFIYEAFIYDICIEIVESKEKMPNLCTNFVNNVDR